MALHFVLQKHDLAAFFSAPSVHLRNKPNFVPLGEKLSIHINSFTKPSKITNYKIIHVVFILNMLEKDNKLTIIRSTIEYTKIPDFC